MHSPRMCHVSILSSCYKQHPLPVTNDARSCQAVPDNHYNYFIVLWGSQVCMVRYFQKKRAVTAAGVCKEPRKCQKNLGGRQSRPKRSQ